MAPYANPHSRVVIKTSRETLVLCAAATAMTFALAYVVHSKPGLGSDPMPSAQDWTGHLASAAPPQPVAESSPEKITSASLVMPKEQLALPKFDFRPLAKLRFCDNGVCNAKADVPLPQPRRDAADRATAKVALKREEPEPQPGLLSRINPLKQVSLRQVQEVPGMLKKPFAYAGDTVSSWFKRF